MILQVVISWHFQPNLTGLKLYASYEVSWENVFFLWDMRSDLTLGYREASEAYQSVMLKWKVHKNAYQAFQLLILAQALYQT